ncbi:uncharacterized protein LOC143562493 [Bidens hawaiensis]|uniref:uncharacterized protein LOC143562493 n=1 Tax=Bidens hawaiensis TaxID=980011 RepID=UPI004048F9F3
MREAWMALPNIPDVLKGWIEMTAKNLGLMKFIMNNDEKILLVVVMYFTNFFQSESNILGHKKRLRKIFKGAVDSLDGTLIHVVVPSRQQDLYRERGKGWEGVAHDSRILLEALSDPHAPFPFPPSEKYYLCDAAYVHIRRFMAPYRNMRYWLGDFRRRRALTNKEKFNHAHAKLRNVIERAFGVLKARFPILKRMAPFSLETQRNVTVACFALHNFIRKQGLDDELFTQYDQPDVSLENSRGQIDADEDEVEALDTSSDREYMTQLRDEIVEQSLKGRIRL